MHKPGDGVYKVCRFELRVRVSHLPLIHISELTNYSVRGSRVRIPSPRSGTNSPPDFTVISSVSWGHNPHAFVMPNVLELNEQTMEYRNTCHTSFRFSHRLLLRKSVGEFLKLGDDRAVSLRSG